MEVQLRDVDTTGDSRGGGILYMGIVQGCKRGGRRSKDRESIDFGGSRGCSRTFRNV